MANADTFRRGIVPKATEQEVHDLLWCCTPFPFRGDVRWLRRHIRKAIKAGGGTVAGAIQHAHDELDRAMAEYRASKATEEA